MRRREGHRMRDRRCRRDRHPRAAGPDASGGTNCGRAAGFFRSMASASAARHHTNGRSTISSTSLADNGRSNAAGHDSGGVQAGCSASDEIRGCGCAHSNGQTAERGAEMLSHRSWKMRSLRVFGDDAGGRPRGGLSHRVRR